MSRVGFIGDVHGEIEALTWALETLSDVQTVVCLGDIVDAPHDLDCIDLLRERGVVVLQGNHDYHRASFSTVRSERYDWLRKLPRVLEREGWMAFHSPHHRDGVYMQWSYVYHDANVREVLRDATRDIVFMGHTHVPQVHELDGGALRAFKRADLLASPDRTLRDGCRYAVNVGRPTQCVVVLDGARLRYRFHPRPRFESRFGELA